MWTSALIYNALVICIYWLLFHVLFQTSFVVFFSYPSLILEQPENGNDATELGNFIIPEISVTSVAGERTGNGEKSRALAENDVQHLQGVQETATDPRTDSKGMPEIRRQKSVRKMMEDGINSSGRVQF